ncbi:MAG: glycosyltransferase 87 family protein [Candidatus Natronoplasma sp.]
MGFTKDLSRKTINAIKRRSTKEKLLILIIVWILIFVPGIMLYNSTQRKEMFSHYPESSSPFNKVNKDWDVSLYANGYETNLSETENRYVISVEEEESINFTWRARNFYLSETADLHIGQVSVHYNTTWEEEGTIILEKNNEKSGGGNETWEAGKTFQESGDVYFYYRVDKRDIARFHRRASVLIKTGNLYEETRTGPPPLINFLFIPPTLLSLPVAWGGYYLSFYIYFSLFILMGAILLFQGFKEWGEEKAFALSILYIINPISLTTIIQDESVIAFIIILTIFILIRGKEKLGALAIGLGSVTKVWSGFFIPAQLFDRNIRFKKRVKNFLVAVSVICGLFLFFYLIWGPKVFWFLKFYGGTHSRFRPRDVSIWRNLVSIPVFIPLPSMRSILIFIMMIELIVLYIAYRKKWDTISIFTVTFFVFLLFYPKMHLDYYLLLLPSLLFYSVRNRRNFKLFIAFFAFLLMSRAVRYLPTGPYQITTWISFIAGVLFTLIGLKIISLFITEDKMTKYFTGISNL